MIHISLSLGRNLDSWPSTQPPATPTQSHITVSLGHSKSLSTPLDTFDPRHFGAVFISLVSQESNTDPSLGGHVALHPIVHGPGAVRDFTSYFDVLAPESQNFARPQVGVWLNPDFFLP